MRIPVLAAALATTMLVHAVQAQQVTNSPDVDRKASTIFVATDAAGTIAAVSIGYSPATWRDSYDGMLDQLEGSNYTRLGTGWWTTFDTVGAVEIGGVKIEAGSYYLGLAVGKDGAFSLLVFDSKQAMQAGLLPHTTALYRGDAKPGTRAPLTFARNSLPAVVARLQIEISADQQDPTTGKFSIRWGKHELTAPARFHAAATASAADPRK